MQQIVDLQNSADFQALDVALVSIATDSQAELTAAAQEDGVTTPLLSDAGKQVSKSYNVLKWAMGNGEPGHTFVLVDAASTVVWLRDYGAPQNGGVMYVPLEELLPQIRTRLN